MTPVAAPDLLYTVPMLFERFLVAVCLWVRAAAAPAWPDKNLCVYVYIRIWVCTYLITCNKMKKYVTKNSHVQGWVFFFYKVLTRRGAWVPSVVM